MKLLSAISSLIFIVERDVCFFLAPVWPYLSWRYVYIFFRNANNNFFLSFFFARSNLSRYLFDRHICFTDTRVMTQGFKRWPDKSHRAPTILVSLPLPTPLNFTPWLREVSDKILPDGYCVLVKGHPAATTSVSPSWACPPLVLLCFMLFCTEAHSDFAHNF